MTKLQMDRKRNGKFMYGLTRSYRTDDMQITSRKQKNCRPVSSCLILTPTCCGVCERTPRSSSALVGVPFPCVLTSGASKVKSRLRVEEISLPSAAHFCGRQCQWMTIAVVLHGRCVLSLPAPLGADEKSHWPNSESGKDLIREDIRP